MRIVMLERQQAVQLVCGGARCGGFGFHLNDEV
jgi:hypothetical protein